MSRLQPFDSELHLPDALPGRVDEQNAHHLVTVGKRSLGRDDSYALIRSSSHAPNTDRAVAVGPIALDRLRSLLNVRELDVLSSVDRFRYLTATQIETLHFAGHASAETAARIRRRVLDRLVAAHLLVRLERRIGGVRAGSSGYVYRIGALGYRVVRGHATMSGRVREPSSTFLDHTLEVAQLSIDITAAARVDSSAIEVTGLEPEPHCWRSFQKGLGGVEVLKPDLFLALGIGEYEDHWFCEVDRGTESTTAVVRKCKVYLDYMRSGIEQKRHDVFPKVLWIVPNARRKLLLEGALRKSLELNAADIFGVVQTADALRTLIGGEQ